MSRAALGAFALAVTAGAWAPRTIAAQQSLKGGDEARNRAATRFTPFADLERGRWGLAISAGAVASDNALSIGDALALKVLIDNDSLLLSDALNALQLIPGGHGLEVNADGGGRVFLGGPLGQRLALGLSSGVRGYARGVLDENVVAFLRDGNAAHPTAELGTSMGEALAVLEHGVHVTFRLSGGPRASGGLTMGAGARYLKPVFHARAGSSIARSVLRVGGDSVTADVGIEALVSSRARPGGSGVSYDAFLGWDLPGTAIEVSVGTATTLSVEGSERRTARFRVRTTSLEEVSDSIDATDFDVTDTLATTVHVPTMVRGRILWRWDRTFGAEFGVAAALGGPFESPAIFDVAGVIRLIPGIPITIGAELGARNQPSYYARTGILTTHFQLEFGASGLGTIGDGARGAGGQVRLGIFF